jgi:N6-L-threonylcarbamoyladenine synthase
MPTILAIESSCDETSAAIIVDGKVRANVISTQLEHGKWGGVIPELASRLHQQQVLRVTEAALVKSGISKQQLDAVAFTRGPGLLGALLVGTCFAKGFALGLGIPLIEINHMQAHVLANFLSPNPPEFPFLCLTVSGGHTQIVLVRSPLDMKVIGQSIDDAAGEAFDKSAKIMGLGYPGGPLIDKLAQSGDDKRYPFPTPVIPGLDYSFSGLKTSLIYFLREQIAKNPDFIEQNKADICASFQRRIITYLLAKFEEAIALHKVKDLAIAGGVSANSRLRRDFAALCARKGLRAHIPEFQYCTDNAGMIAIAAHFKYEAGLFCGQDVVPFTREHKILD